MTSYWWRSHRRSDTLTRALAQNLADTNAQFQTWRKPSHDRVVDLICWGIVIVGIALGLFWVLMNAPASLFAGWLK